MASRSPSHDPSTSEAMEHDPDWRDEVTEDDDDDMDFEPAIEDYDEEDESDIFEDAEENILQALLNNGEVELEVNEEVEEEEEDAEDDDDEPAAALPTTAGLSTTRIAISRDQLIQIIHNRGGLQRLLQSYGSGGLDFDEDEEDDVVYTAYGRPIRRPRRRGTPVELEKVPSEKGQELLRNGVFGNNERSFDQIERKKKLAHRLLRRELGLGTNGQQRIRNASIKQDLIPGSKADAVILYNARCYSGQFSADGNFFFSCGQDFQVRMYDTSNPYQWKYYKTVNNPYGSWTITDASLSSDNKWLAYSSISSVVCLAPTDPNDMSDPRTLDFARLGTGGHRGYNRFAIWSIRFSGDGREIVAGTGDRSVYVFDIESNQSILRIPGHGDDVNAVCFGDAASPHILYSGSDDTTLKVWDRRSLSDGRPAGVFLGHTEGLTYVDSKGDGRYIISNGKDQTAKLWDLRKVIPTEKAERIDPDIYSTGFDYRMTAFDRNSWRPHPHDCSLVTFRGHQVLKTLIRCHFSPPGSSDSRYVYSGSFDGKVYVWNLDATLKAEIDVSAATQFLRSRSRDELDDGFWGGSSGYGTVVRDASWHPDVPVIAATSWNGWGTSMGTCSIHSWNDGLNEDDSIQGMGLRYKARLDPEEPPREEPPRARTSWWRGTRARGLRTQ